MNDRTKQVIENLNAKIKSLKQDVREGKIRESTLKREVKSLNSTVKLSSRIILKMTAEIKKLKAEKKALALDVHREIDYSEELQKKLDEANKKCR